MICTVLALGILCREGLLSGRAVFRACSSLVWPKIVQAGCVAVGRCAMPQLTVELSWFEIGRVILWWFTIIASFYVGRAHGTKSVVPGAPSQMASEKQATPCDTPGPSKAKGSGDETPSSASGCRGDSESFGESSIPTDWSWPPEILMVNGGQALHLDRDCHFLRNAQPKPIRWCSRCGAHAAHRRSKAE